MATKTAKPAVKKAPPKKENVVFIKGDLVWHEGDLAAKDNQGREWAPIACGTHRGTVPFSATGEGYDTHQHQGRAHVGKPRAEGFSPGCEDCAAEVDSTLDSYLRNGGV